MSWEKEKVKLQNSKGRKGGTDVHGGTGSVTGKRCKTAVTCNQALSKGWDL